MPDEISTTIHLLRYQSERVTIGWCGNEVEISTTNPNCVTCNNCLVTASVHGALNHDVK